MSAGEEIQIQLHNAEYRQKTVKFLWLSLLHKQELVKHSQPAINIRTLYKLILFNKQEDTEIYKHNVDSD